MLTRLFEDGDPFLMTYDGKYYIYCTTENNRKLESAMRLIPKRTETVILYDRDNRRALESGRGLC